MEQQRLCEHCGENPVKTSKNRFCSTRCSARWRMAQPENRAKVYTPERSAKISQRRSAYLASPEGQEDRQRLGRLKPSTDPEVAGKISVTLRSMGHKPPVRGGNGQGMTLPQRLLLEALGIEWAAEYTVGLSPRPEGCPTHYKLDLAHPLSMTAVEIDGSSHNSLRARERDERKDRVLTERGWRVLRFSNEEVLASPSSVADRIRSRSTT